MRMTNLDKIYFVAPVLLTSGKARNNQDFDHRIPGATLRVRIVDRVHTFPVYSFTIAVIGVGMKLIYAGTLRTSAHVAFLVKSMTSSQVCTLL
jgi:hypothetical protein